MKIAYLHGLESKIDPKDPKIIWLNDNFTEVYTPQINYKNPGEFDKILRHIKKMNPLYIVGSSMGGYFSYLIGSKLGIKTILFNPAVIGRSFEPVVNVGGIKGAAHNVYFGKSDNVIDGMEVRKYFGSEGAGDFQYNYYNGGHRVPADVFIGAIKETSGITEIYNIENKSTTMIKKFDRFVDEANELKKPTYVPHMDSDDVFFLWDQHFDSRDGIEHGVVRSGNKEYSQFEFGDNINSTSFKYFKKDLEKLANKNRWDFSIDSDSLEIYESFVTEADINDPVLMAFRAAKMKREKELAKPKRKPLYGKQRQKAEYQLWDISQDLKDLYADRGQMLIDMEQEAEAEGGEVAVRFGSELMDIENKIQNLISKRSKLEMRLAESVVNEGVLCEATVIMDAMDPKDKNFLKFLKKHNVEIINTQDSFNGFEITMQGKREDLEKVLADGEYGWDDADLAEYIEESVINEHSLQTNRINESETIYHKYDFEGMWAQKLGMTREEYVAHFATMTAGVDEAKVKDAAGKKFEVKGVSFTYTEQGGRFYGAYLYDVAKTSNVQWRQKLRSISEVTEFLKLHGISEEIPYKYNENLLDNICAELRTQGIECDHNDYFDVS